jgi:hypothetical protein
LILPAVEFAAFDRGSWFSILLRERAHPKNHESLLED